MKDLVQEYTATYVCDTYDLSKKLEVDHFHIRRQLEVVIEDQGVHAPAYMRNTKRGGVEARKLPPMVFILLLGRMKNNPKAKDMYKRALETAILNIDDLIKVAV